MAAAESRTTGARLIVLHQGAIGDFVLALSVVQSLRAHLGADHVTAIATAGSARLAAGRSAVDTWRSPEDVGLHSLFREDGLLDDRLGALLAKADCVLSFLGGSLGPIHGRLCESTAGQVVSVDPRPSSETIARREHVTSQWRAAIRDAGLGIGEPEPPVIRVDPQGEGETGDPPPGLLTGPGTGQLAMAVGLRTMKRRAALGGKRIVVHPGSGGVEKCWPIDRFVMLVESFEAAEVTWLLGPAEWQRGNRFEIVRRRAAAGAGRESLLVEHDVCAAARRVAGADLYIGNDAGMTHVAAAMGVPTIAIFGPTDPAVWRPLGEHVSVVGPDNCGDPIAAVTIEQVKAAIPSFPS